MIELRWIEKFIPVGEAHGMIEGPFGKTEKVLQYRRQIHPKIISDESGKLWIPESQWSDWIDVPTVTDSTA